MKQYIYLLLIFSLYANSTSITSIDKAIKLYETNDGKKYTGGDALATKIRENLDIDIYVGENSIYFEWDEKNYKIRHINIYKNSFAKPIKTIKNSASKIGHRYNGYVDFNLKKSHSYNYRIELILENRQKISQKFIAKTENGDRKIHKRVFKIYDDLEGTGQKSEYLKKNSEDGTLKKFGLENSAMFWYANFFTPKPNMKDADINKIRTKPQLKTLQKLVLQRANSKYPHEAIDKNGGFIILDIEHIPTLVEYVEKEFSPYGSFISKFYDSSEVTQNGIKIVSHAISKKLKCIKAVKEILPNAKVGLWDSVAYWNRYNDSKRNRDNIALAKGINDNWLYNYSQWHKKSSTIYKAMIDVVDYVSPALYPAYDLSKKDGKKKFLGFMMSKLMEIKRLNPDAVVIPTICPQYTEGWADMAGYDKRALNKGDFTWYINQLYTLYKLGYIDSILIWGDNHKTSFVEYTKQDWWSELLQFTNNLNQ